MYNCYYNTPNYYMMESDKDLEGMYPGIYHRVRPIIVMHCNLLEKKYGHMCKPSHKELDEICEDIYDKIKDRLGDIYDDDDHDHDHNHHHDHDHHNHDHNHHHDDCYRRRRRYGRRRALNDLLRILVLGELVGRRRRPYYGYY